MPRGKKTEEEIKERNRAYQRQHYLKQKTFYEAQGTTIYLANKERLDNSNRKYREANHDLICQRRRERYRQKKQASKDLSALFKDPVAAAHFRWLAERNKEKKG